MINKILLFFLNYLINNNFLITLRSKKFKKEITNCDFTNINFDNINLAKNIFLTKKNVFYNEYNEKGLDYHSFNWLNIAKKIGGAESISFSKNQIFLWQKNKYNFLSFSWGNEIVSKRLINLIYNFEFFAVSANKIEKKKLLQIIFKNYFVLNLKNTFDKKEYNQTIEIQKSLLLFKLIYHINYESVVDSIKKHLIKNIDSNGVHISMNPSYQAEYINNLFEIKNMLLFFQKEVPDEIEFQIINMTSSLIKFFHKDNSLAFLNGSNNANKLKIKKICELSKDIKARDLHKIDNGIAIFENKNLKLFLDVGKPNVELLSKNLHSGTLGIEVSFEKEKIITNCGSFEKRGLKKLNYLRFSAAHSTIILNNTNISELSEKKSYKRVPKNVLFESNKKNNSIILHGNHDGYKKNFNKIVSRKLIVSEDNNYLLGEDSIISTKINNQEILYDIRFHLTPFCKASLTMGKNTVLIKTPINNSYKFESSSNLTLKDSVYIEDGKKIEKTTQIVISGLANSFKKNINWKISKL